MIIRRGYRFQLKTNGHESDRLNRFAGSCRLVWNKSLALQKEKLSRGEKFLRYFQVTAELTKWKNEQSFLKEVHSQPLQQTLKDLDQALQNSFKKTYGFPKFKKKVEHDSFRFPRGVKLAGEKIYLPKIGWLKFRKSKEVEGTIKNVTVSKKFDKWYISIQVEIEISEPVHASKTAVGINLGVVRFATLSDGTIIEPLNSFKNAQTKLIREQRKLSRQIRWSGNWKKQKVKIQKIYSKIANVRRDFLHKTTSEISKNHAFIMLEDLKVSNMSKSAKGTSDKPGTNVAAKTGLNRSILDQGWYEFRRQLNYKTEWLGGQVIAVSAINISRQCSRCQMVEAENRQSQAVFCCISCGYREKPT